MNWHWEPVLSGLLLALAAVFLRRISAAMDKHKDAVKEQIDKKLQSLEKGHREQDKSISTLRERVHDIEVRLPEQYVRHADMQREISRIHLGMQTIQDKMDKLLMRV